MRQIARMACSGIEKTAPVRYRANRRHVLVGLKSALRATDANEKSKPISRKIWIYGALKEHRIKRYVAILLRFIARLKIFVSLREEIRNVYGVLLF